MPFFAYKGRDTAGKIVTGQRSGQSATQLGTQLMREGVLPISINEVTERASTWSQLRGFLERRTVTKEELGLFSRQMYVLLKSGVSITAAIRQLAKNTRSQFFSSALYGLGESLESGQDFATALQRYPDIFSPLIINMVRVGQDSGRLDEAFLNINQYLELESMAVKRLKTAIRYPTLVFVAVVSAVIIIDIFVIPTFTNIFKNSQVPLPEFTIILINISNFFRDYWFFILLLGVILAVGIVMYLRTPQGKLNWSRYQLKIPIVGILIKRIILLRFAQTFSIIDKSGIPLVTGLKLVADAMDNAYGSHEIMTILSSIQHGMSLTQAASNSDFFTPLELQMLSVGEETGELGAMFEQIAIYYQREVEYDLKRFNDIIEPLLILMMASIVLVLALAVYLPIWNMIKLVH